MTAKKPQYIRKYDFIDYFTRPENEWFYSSDQILSELTQRIATSLDDTDDEESTEADENDNYSYYQQQKQQVKSLKANDPKIIEGIIIDQKSKEYIIKIFPQAHVYDFDIEYKNNYDFKTQFNRTITILKTWGDLIIFQPVFLASKKIIAKPDALVRIDGKYTLIETKATSKPKAIHILDLFFQKNVLEKVAFETFNFFINEYKLCLIKHCLNKKNTVDFTLTTQISSAKTGPSINNKALVGNRWSLASVQAIADKKLNAASNFNINDFFSDRLEIKAKSKLKLLNDQKLFDSVIETLITHQISPQLDFTPTLKYKNPWKDVEYLPIIKQYYANIPAYWMFSYSGNIINFKDQFHLYMNHEVYSDTFLKNYQGDPVSVSKNTTLKKYQLALFPPDVSLKQQGIFNFNEKTLKLFKTIKTKKVYFDFETLNLALRVMDGLPSFTQVVNQVSIIIKASDTSPEIVKNLLYDPLTIDKQTFKTIIDSILPEHEPHQYSYLVYNKSFEVNRLKEMADYLDDQGYYQKVKVIIDNIFDLADFFNLKNKNHDYQIIICALKGYYSIKKVLALIEIDDPKVFQLTDCKNYLTLNVKNGSEAQNLASLRFLNRVSDTEWNQAVKDLKAYCENDVRAMIAVYVWINKKINIF